MAFSDIADEKSTTQDAINRFAAFGVINGYPDGTFLPDGTITREEFAKIVIVYTGNTVLSDALVNTPSEFTDVKTGEWYTGYVNAAVALGYFQGMGDGTYGIGENVTYGQAITVLLRLAGYTDDLAGAWPYDYVAQGSKGDTKLVQAATAFDVTAPATRKDVVLMAEELLKADVKYYDADTKQYLSVKATKNSVSELFGFDAKESDPKEVAVSYNAKLGLTVDGKALADNFAISNGYGILDIIGKTAVIFVNDDDEVVYVDLKGAYVQGVVTAKDATKGTVTVNGTAYTLAAGEDATVGKYVELTIGADKKASVEELTEEGKAMIVSKIEATKISGFAINEMTQIAIAKDEKFVVVKDGVVEAAGIAAIEVGDLVYARGTLNDVEVYEVFPAYGEVGITSLTGAAEDAVASIIVDGITYKNPALLYKDADMKNFAEFKTSVYTTNKLNGVVGTFYVDQYHNAVAMVYGKLTAPVTTVVGFITDGTLYEKVNSAFGAAATKTPAGYSDLTVLNLAGETVTYAIKDNGAAATGALFVYEEPKMKLNDTAKTVIEKGLAVKLTLNEEGIVTGIEAIALGDDKAVVTNKTYNTISIDEAIFNLAADTPVVQIYNATAPATGKVVAVSKASEVISALNGDFKVVMNTTGTAVSYIVTGKLTAVTTDETRVVFLSEYVEGNKVQFAGDATLYDKVKDFSTDAKAGDIVTFELTGGKVSKIDVAVEIAEVDIFKLTAVAGNVASYKVAVGDAETSQVEPSTENKTAIIGEKAVVYVYDNNGTAGEIGEFSAMGTVADIVKDAYVGFADVEEKDGLKIYNTIIVVK